MYRNPIDIEYVTYLILNICNLIDTEYEILLPSRLVHCIYMYMINNFYSSVEKTPCMQLFPVLCSSIAAG